jgi:hypothetical protein
VRQTICPDVVVLKSPPDLDGLVPEEVVDAIWSNDWSERSIMELSALVFIALNGGIWISPEVYMIEKVDVLDDLVPFCATNRGNILNPCVFGLEKGSVAAGAALEAVKDLLLNERKDLLIAQMNTSILTPVFEKLANSRIIAALPYQSFAVFGITQFAQRFARSNTSQQAESLSRMAGRTAGQVLFGVFTGKQNLISRFRSRIDEEIRVQPERTLPQGSEKEDGSQPVIEASLGQMIRSAGTSALTAGKNAFMGKRVKAAPEEIERRKTICMGNAEKGIPKCEFFNDEKNRCSKCGCWVRHKMKLEHESCPEGKW